LRHQGPQHSVAIDAADLFDLASVDRLAVGDDRQRLERRRRRLARRLDPQEFLDNRGELGRTDELDAVSATLQPNAARLARWAASS